MELSYGNPTCNHDVNDLNPCNYFDRGKHANGCYDDFNDPLYVPKPTKLPQSSRYIVNFAFNACNFYERGGDKCPLYASNSYKLHSSTDNIHWYTLVCCGSFIYKMTMHRKKVRLHCYLIHAL